MAEEATNAAGDPVITPKGMHRSEGMAADLPEGVEYPQGVTGKTTADNDDNVNTGEGGDGKSSQAVPGTV
jgi:hypothetical protein